MKKFIILFLNTLIFFAFCENNIQKSNVQDSLKKHLLGNSISGAIATCATSALVPPSISCLTIMVANNLFVGDMIDYSKKSFKKGVFLLTAISSGCNYLKNGSSYLIPHLIGSYIAITYVIPRMVKQ